MGTLALARVGARGALDDHGRGSGAADPVMLRHARASSSIASVSCSSGSANGTRTNRSSVPSTPNRGPGGISRPSRDAAADIAELIGAGSRTHSDMPPVPGSGLPVGQMLARAVEQQRATRPQDLPAFGQHVVGSSVEKPCGGELFDDRRAHVDGRAQRARWSPDVARSARIQPIRRPPQNDFDIEPTVSTRSRRVVIDAATGAGTGSSSHMSVIVSSMIVRVRVSAMMSRQIACGRQRACVSPVGLWLSGIR